MRCNLLVVGTLLGVGVINAAAAADLPVKAPVRAPPVLYNWSGLYLGANVGGAWSNRSIAGTALGDPFSTPLIGGFQLGYNLQGQRRTHAAHRGQQFIALRENDIGS